MKQKQIKDHSIGELQSIGYENGEQIRGHSQQIELLQRNLDMIRQEINNRKELDNARNGSIKPSKPSTASSVADKRAKLTKPVS